MLLWKLGKYSEDPRRNTGKGGCCKLMDDDQSSTLLSVHVKLYQGLYLLDVTGEQQPPENNDAYVDDVDMYVSSPWAVTLNKWLNIKRRLR